MDHVVKKTLPPPPGWDIEMPSPSAMALHCIRGDGELYVVLRKGGWPRPKLNDIDPLGTCSIVMEDGGVIIDNVVRVEWYDRRGARCEGCGRPLATGQRSCIDPLPGAQFRIDGIRCGW